MVLETFPHSYTSPHILWWIFETPQLIISWVWVICKRLNVNRKNIDSIILSVTCHSLINFPPLIHIPSYAFINSWNPTSYYFLSLSHSLKVECDLEKNSLSIFICHLSFIKKLFPTHKHSLVCIHEFLKPYKLYFLSLSHLKKRWNVNWKKIPSIMLSVIFHGCRNFPPLLHISLYPLMNFWNPTIDYFSSLSHLLKIDRNWKKITQ